MIDMLFYLALIIVICLITLAVIFSIPKLIILKTESEGNPDHIYKIFMDESGWRGQKILSAAGCLFPFIELSKRSNEVEGIVLVLAISIGCFFYHSSVYKGYSVLTKNMKLVLALILSFLTAISLLAREGILIDGATIFLIPFGVIWGGYAVYRRSVLIHITRLSSKDGLTPVS